MRIAIISDYPPMRGGIAHHAQSLAEELVKKGNHVDVFTFKEVPDKTNTNGLGIISYLTDTRHYRKYLLNSPALTEVITSLYWAYAGRKLLKELKDYDVVHLQYEMGMFHPLMLRCVSRLKKYGVRTAVTKHERYSPLLEKTNNYYIRQFDKVIVFTEEHKKKLLEENISKDKIGVCHFGIRNNPNTYQVSPPDLSKHVGILGMFLPRKGYVEAIRAFSHAIKEVPEAKLCIAGMPAPSMVGKKYYWRMNEEIIRNNLQEKAKYLGYVEGEKLEKFYSNINVLLLPYDNITQSSALFDTFARGVPVIASDIQGFSEFVENNETGWLVNKDDIKEFGSVIAYALRSPEALQRMRENIREYNKRHSWEGVVDDYLRIYAE